MSRIQMLRLIVQQRLTAAAEEIFGVFEKAVEEYEEEIDRHRRLLLDVLKNGSNKTDPSQLFDYKEKVPSEQQGWQVILGQEELESPHIKQELEEFWTSQEEEQLQRIEEADIIKLPFSPGPLKRENDDRKLPSSQLHESHTENKHAEALASTSTEQMKTECDEGDFCLTEPAGNLDQDGNLDSTSDGEPLPSDYCESETEDSDGDWNKTSKPRSGLDANDNNEIGHQISIRKKTFMCSVCGKGFTQRGHMQRHMRTHTGEKPYRCSVCGNAFSQRGDMLRHMRIHTGEKPFSCTICGKEFSQRGQIQPHMRTHTGEKPFSCSVCGKRFCERGHLQTHMRTHTGEKPFSCTICGKGFTQRGILQTHMRIHTGEKPFSCSVCGKEFSQKRVMQTHMKIHTREKTSVGFKTVMVFSKRTVRQNT